MTGKVQQQNNQKEDDNPSRSFLNWALNNPDNL